MMYIVYILYSPTVDRYYIGMTSNLVDRVRRHNSKSNGFTNRANDWIIKYSEAFQEKELAQQREKEIKNWKSRKLIEKLISTAPSEHSD